MGSYFGTMAGALVLTLLTSLLTALDLPESMRLIVYGATLLLLLSSTAARKRSGSRGHVPGQRSPRIGLLGSGFIAGFHLQALLGVRDAEVRGVFSPTLANREALARRSNEMGLGPCRAYGSVDELLPLGRWMPSGSWAQTTPASTTCAPSVGPRRMESLSWVLLARNRWA